MAKTTKAKTTKKKETKKKYQKHGIMLMRKIRKIYFMFVALNAAIKGLGLGDRAMNIPECISEGLASYLYGFARNIGCAGDTTNLENGQIIEVKAASSQKEHDTTQISPSAQHDDLCFLRFDTKNHLVYTYLLGLTNEDVNKLSVNKNQTVGDQKEEKRRARLSFEKIIIEPNSIEPDYIFDMKTLKTVGGKLWKQENLELHHSSPALAA